MNFGCVGGVKKNVHMHAHAHTDTKTFEVFGQMQRGLRSARPSANPPIHPVSHPSAHPSTHPFAHPPINPPIQNIQATVRPMHPRLCWFEVALTPHAPSVETMSTTRKARDGYFYALREFVTWYGDVRGPYEWDQAEESAGAEEPSAKQAGRDHEAQQLPSTPATMGDIAKLDENLTRLETLVKMALLRAPLNARIGPASSPAVGGARGGARGKAPPAKHLLSPVEEASDDSAASSGGAGASAAAASPGSGSSTVGLAPPSTSAGAKAPPVGPVARPTGAGADTPGIPSSRFKAPPPGIGSSPGASSTTKAPPPSRHVPRVPAIGGATTGTMPAMPLLADGLL